MVTVFVVTIREVRGKGLSMPPACAIAMVWRTMEGYRVIQVVEGHKDGIEHLARALYILSETTRGKIGYKIMPLDELGIRWFMTLYNSVGFEVAFACMDKEGRLLWTESVEVIEEPQAMEKCKQL